MDAVREAIADCAGIRHEIARQLTESGIAAWRCHREWLAAAGRSEDEALHDWYVTETLRRQLRGPKAAALPDDLVQALHLARERDQAEFPEAFAQRAVQAAADPWRRMIEILWCVDPARAHEARVGFHACARARRKDEKRSVAPECIDLLINKENYFALSRSMFSEFFGRKGFNFNKKISKTFRPVYSYSMSPDTFVFIAPESERNEKNFTTYKTRWDDSYQGSIGFVCGLVNNKSSKDINYDNDMTYLLEIVPGFRDSYSQFATVMELAVIVRAYAELVRLVCDHARDRLR
jgi:hypothetical protein